MGLKSLESLKNIGLFSILWLLKATQVHYFVEAHSAFWNNLQLTELFMASSENRNGHNRLSSKRAWIIINNKFPDIAQWNWQIFYAILTYPKWPDKVVYVSVSLKIRELFLLQEEWLFSPDSKFKRYTNLLPAKSSLVCGSQEFKSWLQNLCRWHWFITVFTWEVLAKFFS